MTFQFVIVLWEHELVTKTKIEERMFVMCLEFSQSPVVDADKIVSEENVIVYTKLGRFEFVISRGLLTVEELQSFCLINASEEVPPDQVYIVKKVACIYWNIDISQICISELMKNLYPLKRYVLLSGLVPDDTLHSNE